MSPPVKIFIEGHTFDTGYEGVTTFIGNLYCALLREFPDTFRLFVGCRSPDRAATYFPPAAPIEYLHYRSGNRYTRLALDVPALCRRAAPDFAHFQYFTPIRKSCAWIVTIHDLLFNDFPQYFPSHYRYLRNVLFPASARRADILTTVSDYAAESLVRHYHLDPRAVNVVPNGVELRAPVSAAELNEELPESVPAERPFILCVSRHEPRKNQVTLLRAYRRLQLWDRDIHLVFVGARTLAVPAFDTLLNSMPAQAQQCIHFLENISRDQLMLLYSRAALAVYPSLAEGFGLPPLESAGLGTPTLCSNTTAMADYAFFGAYQFDPADFDSLCRRIETVLQDPQGARRDFANMRTLIAQRYNWTASARRFAGLVLGAAGRDVEAVKL